MNATMTQPEASVRRIEELGRIIMAYSEVTEKLQQSHDQLKQTVQHLRSELSEKNRELERKNRLAALGEMAAGLAHEIRNPLGGMQLYASLLAQDLEDRPDSRQLVCKVSDGVRRLESLVSQVLQFSRDIRASKSRMDLAEIVEQSVELTTRQCGAKQIDVDVDGPRPMIALADKVLIGQAILNLLLNAIEAMDQAGTIRVRWSAPPVESDAKQFQIVIHDSGPGIPSDILDRIFNPFFTTKDTGTGLGLAIVHRVVEAHDGTITATNDPAGGARFEIRI